MKKSGKWFSLAAALSVTAIVGAGCSMSNGDAQKDTKTTAETKQTEQKTADSKKSNTQNSEFSLESQYFNDIKKSMVWKPFKIQKIYSRLSINNMHCPETMNLAILSYLM